MTTNSQPPTTDKGDQTAQPKTQYRALTGRNTIAP